LIEQRERNEPRERYPSIELTDSEHLARFIRQLEVNMIGNPTKITNSNETNGSVATIELTDEVVYRPCTVDKNSPEYLKQKKALEEVLRKKTEIVTFNKEPHAQNKSKSPKKTARKANPKSD
jgi:homoserine dehydrogenase